MNKRKINLSEVKGADAIELLNTGLPFVGEKSDEKEQTSAEIFFSEKPKEFIKQLSSAFAKITSIELEAVIVDVGFI